MNKGRNIRLDLLRVLMMCFVIGIHTPMEALDLVPTFRTYYFVILFISDAGFFTLSGYFLLQKKFSGAEDYRHYYYSRFVTIFFPILIFHFVLDLLFHRFVFQIGVAEYIKSYWLNLLSNDYGSYLWFLYVYIPLVIFAPFISKALNHLSQRELALLALIAVGWELLEWYCNANGIAYYFGSHLIASWTIYFILGHYFWRLSDELHRLRFAFYVLGIIGLLIAAKNCVGDVIPGSLVGKPYYMLLIFGFFVLFLHGVKIEKMRHVSAGLTFIAKHSFTVYLTHFEIIEHVKNYLNRFYDLIHFTPALGVHYVLNLALNIVCSILFAVILDELIIFRIQSLFRLRLR